MMQQEYSDDECFVCFDLMWYPCRTPCGHYICLECLESILGYNRSCPLCRNPFEVSYSPTVDKERQSAIKKTQEAGFLKRAQEIQSQGLTCNSLQVIYGNTHKIIDGRFDGNTHAWVAYVKLSDGYLDISKYIQKVVFTLHPTFSDPVREITSAPFKVALYGWGEFNIPIVIHWQPWLQKEPTKLSHCISFEGTGDSVMTNVMFDKSIFSYIQEKEQPKLQNEEQAEGRVGSLTVVYGNSYERINDSEPKQFLWNVSVELKEDHLDISKYVEKVVYTLPPTFQDQNLEVTSAPFIVSFVGVEDFRLCIFVHWKPWMQIEPTKLTHFISEEDSDEYFPNVVHFNKQLLKEEKPEPMQSENSLTIVYGNSHQLIQENDHAWCTFVTLEDKNVDINQYIRKVVFTLHPTFKNPVREISKAPFEVNSSGWGKFRIPITIYWQDWLKMKPTKINHDLSFEDDGETLKKTIYFN